MQHITYRPVDRQFRCIQADLPEGAPFNRVDPISGITFGFALASRYPEEIYFGTVDGKVADNPAIGLRAITEDEYRTAEAAEAEALRPPVPASVTMRQARLALLAAEILDDAEAAIAGMEGSEGKAAQIEWEYATELRREHPLVQALGVKLGLDRAAVDALFEQAAAIP